MSKELEALDRLIAIGDESKYWNCDDYVVDVNAVKQALQELQAIKNSNPSKALELVSCLKDYLLNMVPYYDWLNDIEKYILKAQEQEKALKIIKEKYVHIPQLLCAFENQLEEANPLEVYYNGQVGINVPMPLTQEEFDLLKRNIL